MRAAPVIWMLAATLLASGCGPAGPATAQGDGSAASDACCALGGTVRGATRPGLVLANGNSSVVVSAHTTRFTLPAPVAYGSRYSVTTAAQPAGLSCSVSNGSGPMPAGNVSSVKVECSDDADSIGQRLEHDVAALMMLLWLARSAHPPRS